MGFPIPLAVSFPNQTVLPMPNSTFTEPRELVPNLEETRQLHAHMIRNQFQQVALLSSLHSSPAAKLNLIISSYTKNGRPQDVLKIYRLERSCDYPKLDNFTVPSLLKACALLSRARDGEEIHGFSLKLGIVCDVYVQNALIHMYTECAQAESATQMFENMPEKDLVSWSTMIRCFTRSKLLPEAVALVKEMTQLQVPFTESAMVSVLSLCAELQDLSFAKALHGWMTKTSGSPDTMGVSSSTAMVDMYVKCGSIDFARQVFNVTVNKNVATWTSIITGHVRLNQSVEGLSLLAQMQREGIFPNEITMLSLAIEIGALGDLELVRWLHAFVLRRTISVSVVLLTAIMDMYSKSGDAERARTLFDGMLDRDVAAWTAMISGYIELGRTDQAMELLQLMMKDGKVKPNLATMTSILNLCRDVGALTLGRWVHTWIIREGLKLDAALATSLIDMYASSGNLEAASDVFYGEIAGRDIPTWNAMIGGLAMHGRAREALQLVSQMEDEGASPNHITCVAVLHACSHAGMVAEGKAFFKRMESELQVRPRIEHYGCLVDLLARAGLLEQAYQLIKKMPIRPNVAVWGALLAGCKLHKNAQLGEVAAKQVLELQPGNLGYSVLLSNMYAMARRWGEVAEVRKSLWESRVKKPPGFSSIEVEGSVHWFTMGDNSHPRSFEIRAMVREMMHKMKEVGYVADTSAVLLNVDEEEKETVLAHHSEKLAIAFGLISTTPPVPIRVIKNLRICVDCHSAAKFISLVYNREIIVRDRNRFHHFSQGSCSCRDYW